MSDYSFIKEFQNIKLSEICKEKGINLSNVINGTTTEENFKRVKKELLRKLLMLMIEDMQESLLLVGLYNEILETKEQEIKSLKEML